MLLFFRGELTDPFLCWLREPPMATAQSGFVPALSPDALCVGFLSWASPPNNLPRCYSPTRRRLPWLTALRWRYTLGWTELITNEQSRLLALHRLSLSLFQTQAGGRSRSLDCLRRWEVCMRGIQYCSWEKELLLSPLVLAWQYALRTFTFYVHQLQETNLDTRQHQVI